MNTKVDTSWMKPGTRCWVYDQDRYLKARIGDTKGRAVSFANVPCELQDRSKQDYKPQSIQRRNESSALVNNLVDLEYINDAEILYQLEQRFRLKNIFTFIGSNLLVINPYELIAANYDHKMIDRYHDEIYRKQVSFKEIDPHIYGLVGQVFKEINGSQADQAIVISGQSGSGKTETNKYCLKYLTHVCGAMQGRKSYMEDKIMSCNPLLEGFGNAKTVKNDNSSRFGKLTTLRVNKRTFQITSASIRSYFLQKSRLPYQNIGEMNFHVFYYFVKGLPLDEHSRYHMKNSKGQLMTVDSFQCLKSKQPHKTNTADQTSFNEIRQAFNLLKFTKEQQESIWSVVAAILHLSNVDFDHSKYEESKRDPGEIIDTESFSNACKLLGLNTAKLEKAMLFRSRTILKEVTMNPQPQASCRSTRDSMMKTLYENLFQWIIGALNLTLKDEHSTLATDEYVSLRLLDIYGFEVFQTNGFEQLCVNYTNERLHQLYIEQVFKQQKKIFEDEGLGKALESITFSDNRRIIELLDTQPNSVFNLLDQSCSVKSDNMGLLNNIRKNLVDKPNEVFPDINKRMTKNAFIVKHTPSEIQYAIEGFRERNIDEVREDLIVDMAASELPLLREMFTPYVERLGKGKESKARYLGRKIRDEISTLITELQTGTDVHFIRCIKPNDEKKPFTFVPKMALTQIKYLGLLDTILLRKATYHVRVPYDKFYESYSEIEFPLDDKVEYYKKPASDRNDTCRALFQKYFPDTAIQRLFGVARIFMKEGSMPIVDKIFKDRMKKIKKTAAVIVQYSKSKIQSAKAEQQIALYKIGLRLQPYMKNFVYVVQRNEAIATIEGFFHYDAKLILAKLKERRIQTLQNFFRRTVEVNLAQRRKRNIRTLELYMHNLARVCFTNKFLELNHLLRTKVFDMVWEQYRKMQISKIECYIAGLKVRAANVQVLQKAEERTHKVLAVKYRISLRVYLKGFAVYSATARKMRAIIKIQSFQRMRVIRAYYQNMRNSAILIQTAWRQYRQRRAQNIRMIEDLFHENESRREYSSLLFNEILHRQQKDNPQERPRQLQSQSVEAVLSEHALLKTSKIGLFYYILDIEPLIDIEDVYENNSWIDNYFSLFRDGLLKHNNPVQYLQVGEFHTMAATCTRLYSWGWNDHQQLGIENIRVPNSQLNTINLPHGSKFRSFYADENFSSVDLEEPPVRQFFGKVPEDVLSAGQQVYRNLKSRYTINGGVLVEFQQKGIIPVGISEKDKVLQVACGMAHVICRTSLKKILSWGEGSDGQLGHGDYLTHRLPKSIEYFAGDKHHIVQVAAAARCSLVVYDNHRIYWFGSNTAIEKCHTPTEVAFHHKSNYLWDSNKYTPIRVVATWSKSLSIIGVTFAWHNGVLPTNISLKKKVLQQLAIKWNEQSINTVLPPYIRSLTHYFMQKCMRLPVYRPDIQMQSRKKLHEFRSTILQQLKSLKLVERELQEYPSSDPF